MTFVIFSLSAPLARVRAGMRTPDSALDRRIEQWSELSVVLVRRHAHRMDDRPGARTARAVAERGSGHPVLDC